MTTSEEKIIERTVDRLDKTKCLSSKLDFTMAGMIINSAIQEMRVSWIEQLEQAKAALSKLRSSIRGNSPSQKQMSDRLLDAINIVSTQISIEKVLAR